VGDGKSFADINPEEMCAGEGGHELEGVGGEAADDSIGTTNEDQLFTHRQTIGTGSSKFNPFVEKSSVIEFTQKTRLGMA